MKQLTRWFGPIELAVICVLLMTPFFQGRYLSIPISTDMTAHETVIQGLANGTPVHIIYAGQAIVCWPIAMIWKLTHVSIDTLYLFFNFIVLVGAALSIYSVTSKLAGRVAAWIATPMCLFVTTSIFGLFAFGVIFNIINMYVILPWAIYFGIKAWNTKRKPYTAIAISLLVLFCVFHWSGLYMAGVIGTLIAYWLAKKRKVWAYALISVLIIGITVLGFYHRLLTSETGGMVLSFGTFISSELGYVTSFMLVASLFGMWRWRKTIVWGKETKPLLLVFAMLIIPMALAMSVNFMNVSVRVGSDCATLLAWATAIIMAKIIQSRDAMLGYGAMAVIGVGAGSNLALWMR